MTLLLVLQTQLLSNFIQTIDGSLLSKLSKSRHSKHVIHILYQSFRLMNHLLLEWLESGGYVLVLNGAVHHGLFSGIVIIVLKLLLSIQIEYYSSLPFF